MAVIQGIGPDGKTPINIPVDWQGRQIVQPDPADPLAPLLLEMRACRIGLELLNRLKPGSLIELANEG
jgi:hypothetical protein